MRHIMKIAATACLGLHGASGPGATTQHVQAASNFLKISDRVLIRSERRAPLTEADLPLSAARCVEAVRAVEGDNEAASRTSDKEESVTTTILQEEATPFANRSALNRARVLDPRLGSMLKPEQATVCGACRTVKILVDEAANKRCGEGGAEVACPRMSARDVWNHNLKAGFMAAAIGDGDDAAPRDPARDTTYQSLRVCNGLAPKLHRARETHFVSHRTDFAVSIGKTAGNVCGARLKRLARALLAAVHGVVRRELGSFQSAADRQQMRESGFLRAPTATKSGIPMAELVLLELETVVGHRDHSWGTNAPLGDLIPENDTFTVSMLLEGPDFVDGCMGCGSKIAGAYAKEKTREVFSSPFNPGRKRSFFWGKLLDMLRREQPKPASLGNSEQASNLEKEAHNAPNQEDVVQSKREKCAAAALLRCERGEKFVEGEVPGEEKKTDVGKSGAGTATSFPRNKKRDEFPSLLDVVAGAAERSGNLLEIDIEQLLENFVRDLLRDDSGMDDARFDCLKQGKLLAAEWERSLTARARHSDCHPHSMFAKVWKKQGVDLLPLLDALRTAREPTVVRFFANKARLPAGSHVVRPVSVAMSAPDSGRASGGFGTAGRGGAAMEAEEGSGERDAEDRLNERRGSCASEEVKTAGVGAEASEMQHVGVEGGHDSSLPLHSGLPLHSRLPTSLPLHMGLGDDAAFAREMERAYRAQLEWCGPERCKALVEAEAEAEEPGHPPLEMPIFQRRINLLQLEDPYSPWGKFADQVLWPMWTMLTVFQTEYAHVLRESSCALWASERSESCSLLRSVAEERAGSSNDVLLSAPDVARGALHSNTVSFDLSPWRQAAVGVLHSVLNKGSSSGATASLLRTPRRAGAGLRTLETELAIAISPHRHRETASSEGTVVGGLPRLPGIGLRGFLTLGEAEALRRTCRALRDAGCGAGAPSLSEMRNAASFCAALREARAGRGLSPFYSDAAASSGEMGRADQGEKKLDVAGEQGEEKKLDVAGKEADV